MLFIVIRSFLKKKKLEVAEEARNSFAALNKSSNTSMRRKSSNKASGKHVLHKQVSFSSGWRKVSRDPSLRMIASGDANFTVAAPREEPVAPIASPILSRKRVRRLPLEHVIVLPSTSLATPEKKSLVVAAGFLLPPLSHIQKLEEKDSERVSSRFLPNTPDSRRSPSP